MFKLFKKTLAVCLIGFGLRSITCNITSNDRLAIYYRYCINCSGISMASLLRKNKGVHAYENSGKKSA